jgi:subtilisin family serine protease
MAKALARKSQPAGAPSGRVSTHTPDPDLVERILAGVSAKRELAVVARREPRPWAAKGDVPVWQGGSVEAMTQRLASEGILTRPVFVTPPEWVLPRVGTVLTDAHVGVPDLSVYHQVIARDDELDDLAAHLRRLDVVEASYVKPPPALPLPQWLNTMVPSPSPPPSSTPDFTSRQGYLAAAPYGIDVQQAWHRTGGRGANVKRLVGEWAWQFDHEDLQYDKQLAAGVPSSIKELRNHGTAVAGVIRGSQNGFGITGICPDAIMGTAAVFDAQGNFSVARAIQLAVGMLRPGDVILIEIHRPGPHSSFQGNPNQSGYLPAEWWPEELDAIRYAVSMDIVVVAAAGNGDENLDHGLYDTSPGPPYGPFPSWWSNPFRRNAVDSGAILVGAGAPPRGTHGKDHGKDRSRLQFSNYGSCVDAQGWGREVASCGYGDLQGGPEERWYTDEFAGTSSATPIVVGIAACLQGIVRSGGTLLTSTQVRRLLQQSGTPQQDESGRPSSQRIGALPDLRDLVRQV